MSLMGDFIFVFFEISGVRLIYIYILNFLFIVGIIESLFWKRFKWQNMQCKSNSVRKPIRKHNLTLFYVKKRKVFFYLFIYLFKSDAWKYVCLLIFDKHDAWIFERKDFLFRFNFDGTLKRFLLFFFCFYIWKK